MYGVELGIMIVGTLCLALAGDGPGISIIGSTIFYRIVIGIGIGGDYPSSSVISSEFAGTNFRGAMMTKVFACQGLGQLCSAMVSLFLALGFKASLQSSNCDTDDCRSALDKSWRILYGLGIIPACIALGFRATIPETPRFTSDVRRDDRRAVADARWYI